MANSHTVIVDHTRDRSRWRAPDTARAARPGGGAAPQSPLEPIEKFGANPGALTMLAFAPENLPSRSPLIVVLHGCSQNAHGYDAAAGWSRLAEELGFAVLFPEQKTSNNAGGCFNWFLTADSARGLGETRSIHEMVEFMVSRHSIDRGRIYVTGLSAGGAMAAALLADYPELFAGGAIIAGLPCGAATSVREALRVMTQPAEKSAEELGDQVRAGSPGEGPWPRVMVLHGTRDTTVSPKNGDALVSQWLNVHGVAPDEFAETALGEHQRRSWAVGGRSVVESILVKGMGHGAPLDGALGERKAPFMLDVGLSSTREIANFFGIKGAIAAEANVTSVASPGLGSDEREIESATQSSKSEAVQPSSIGWFDIGVAINKALKRAGLKR